MDTDLMLTAGIILLVLCIPALLQAFTEGRPPRIAAVVLLVAAGLILYSLTAKPGGYTFAEMPDVVMRVFGRAFQ